MTTGEGEPITTLFIFGATLSF